MFQDNYPVFSRDMILKAEMLEHVKSYPRDMFQILYKDFCDGIISGANVVVRDGKKLEVQPGILKKNGRLYVLSESVMLDEIEIGVDQVVKVTFLPEEEKNGICYHETELTIGKPEELMENELELCRFQLKEGAMLRQDYQNFQDLATKHNTINIIHTPFAFVEENTISPEILMLFGKEMLQYKLSDGFDISFVSMCMQNKPIHRQFIEKYIGYRVENVARGRLTNEQIHMYMTKIIDLARLGKSSSGVNRGAPRRMLVD